MYGLSLIDKFKSLDVYRKLPPDFVKPTYSGAMLSIISSVIMLLLFLNEFSSYREIKTSSQMFIDVNRGGDKLTINVDVELTHLPCSILSIDIQDVMGSHSVNLEGNIMKYRLDKTGKAIGQEPYKSVKLDIVENETHGHDHFAQPDYEMVKNQLKNNEGCRIKGYFLVNKVPGNFHISSHAFGPTIQRLAQEGLLSMDLNHKINHLSFGNDEELRKVKHIFHEGVLNPLDGKVKNGNKYKAIYEYYIKVVPTTYDDINGMTYYVHQFTYNANETPTYEHFPTLYFRYELSPVTVKYTQYKDSFLNFFIQICAILGGVFAVTGIIDAMIHKSVIVLLQKEQRGKLG